jgi:hypothetical protein
MAKKPSSSAVKGEARQLRSTPKTTKSQKNEQLNTPPPETGISDNIQRPKGDTHNKAPADKAEETPSQLSDHAEPPTLEPLSVSAHIPGSPASNHGGGSDQDSDSGSPITHIFSHDPLTGKKKDIEATLYCPVNNNVFMYLPALNAGQDRRLFVKSAAGKELGDKMRSLEKRMKKDKDGNYINAPNRVSPKDLTKKGMYLLKAFIYNPLKPLGRDKSSFKLIGAGYQVPKDGILPSQILRRNDRLVWKFQTEARPNKDHPKTWCLVSGNKEGEDREGKDDIWILTRSEWVNWKGESFRKEIERPAVSMNQPPLHPQVAAFLQHAR